MCNECKKNVKYLLKDTHKEISIGDEVTCYQSISFSKYPNTSFETTLTHPVDEEDIKDLLEAEIIEKVEEKPVEDYTTYLKWLADVEGFAYKDVISSFGLTLQVNPSAAISILLKAISRKVNKNCNITPRKIWIVDITTKQPIITDVKNDNYLKNIAWFLTKTDAEDALKVCEPILNK